MRAASKTNCLAPPAAQPAGKRFRPFTRWRVLAPGLLLPGQALADMGNFTDGFIYTLVAIGLLGMLIWTLVPWLVYRALRGHGTALRVLVAALVWTMPAWALMGTLAFASI